VGSPWVERHANHGHVTAVGAACDADPARIGITVAAQIVHAVFEVFDAVHAERPVVEIHEALAEA